MTRMEAIEARIRAKGRVDLDALENAGADRDEIVHRLALIAAGSDGGLSTKAIEAGNRMRDRIDTLRRLAGRAMTLAADIEKALSKNPGAQFERESRPEVIIDELRKYAGEWEKHAQAFGHFLRSHHSWIEEGIAPLLVCVRVYTGSMDRLRSEQVARLLADAYGAAGKPDPGISPEALRQVFKRRHGDVLGMLNAQRQKQGLGPLGLPPPRPRR